MLFQTFLPIKLDVAMRQGGKLFLILFIFILYFLRLTESALLPKHTEVFAAAHRYDWRNARAG